MPESIDPSDEYDLPDGPQTEPGWPGDGPGDDPLDDDDYDEEDE